MLPGMERSMLAGLQQRHLVTSLPHLTPNLYEMAALTQELDTQVQAVNNHLSQLCASEMFFFLKEIKFVHSPVQQIQYNNVFLLF
jgi:hypothetical protein